MNGNDSPATPGAPDSSTQTSADQAGSLHRIIAELAPLRTEDRRRLLETVATFFGLDLQQAGVFNRDQPVARATPVHGSAFKFSEEAHAPSPKSFMLSKSPKTDVERVACLAYYLAHYRGTPHFKTKDITDLNTESAHRRFSNTADAVDNAAKLGYLVPSIKGAKQLSALGERYVEALPDRDAAKEIFQGFNRRRGGGTNRKGYAKVGKE